MSVIPVEKTFPRGGFQEGSSHPKPRATNTRSLFHVAKKPRHIPRHESDGKQSNTDAASSIKKEPREDKEFFRIKKYTGQLNYRNISEGMPTLAVIFGISELEIKLALPGNIVATVPITNISETYTEALRNAVMHNSGERIAPLREMFKIGQYVVAKIVGKVCENNRNKITASLNPQILYSDVPVAEAVEGTVVMAAVKSIEEKVYLMDLGNKITRAFLSLEDAKTYVQTWNDGKPLGIGQVVRCLVKKVSTLDSTTTLLLAADPVKVARATCDETGATLETLMPGMRFTAKVSRLFATGIQIQLSDNVVGYVHKDHFETPFKSPQNYEIGATVKAQVLYILPSGAIYFTLKPNVLLSCLPVDPYGLLKCGAVVEDAEVSGVSDAGLVLKLGPALKGFVPLKQTAYKPQTALDEFDTPLAQQLATQFPPQSKVTCRVIDFNRMEQFYVCTMDPELMKVKIVNPALLEVGMVLACVVKEIVPKKGIVLTLGKGCRATGFVPSSHVADVFLSDPAKKFSVGQTVLARVLSLKDGKYVFTLKRLLVEGKAPILSSLADAKVGDRFQGTVMRSDENGAAVQFFNMVSGWLPAAKDKRHAPHFGQLITVKVARVDAHTQTLELTTENPESHVNGTKKESSSNASNVSSSTAEDAAPQLSSVQKYRMARELKATAEKLPTDGKLTNGRQETDTDSRLSKRTARKLKKEAAEALRQDKEPSGGEEVEPPVLSKRAAKKLAKEGRKRTQGQMASDGAQELDKNANEAQTAENSSKKALKDLEESAASTTQSSKKKKKSEITRAEAASNIEPVTAYDKKSKDICTDKETSDLTSTLSSKKKAKKRKNSECEADEHTKNEATSTPGKVSKLMSLLSEKKTAPLKAKEKTKTSKNVKPVVEVDKKKPRKNQEGISETSMWQEGISETSMWREGISPLMAKEKPKKSQNAKRVDEEATGRAKRERESCRLAEEAKLGAGKKRRIEHGTLAAAKPVVSLPRVSVANGFVWNATPRLLPVLAAQNDVDDDSTDDEVDDKSSKVKKTRQAIAAEKRIQAQQEEARLRKIEQRLMDADAPPQSADEFDRLVLSSPDSSMVWLQYMALHLQATEIEKARGVAQRAIKTISFREEQERQNVWVALLNLENLYGTRESLEATLDEAVLVCDAYQVYTKMLNIYAESHKLEEGEKLVGVITKKFKTNKESWFNAAMFYMRSSQVEKARALMNRALACTHKQEHVAVISRFAAMENKLGSAERAQTLMEQILATYPRRIDVWSAYVDMLVKSGLIDLARKVLERAVAQKVPSHKMKTLFKKFLAFEEAHGTEAGMENVRQMAFNYVESASSF